MAHNYSIDSATKDNDLVTVVGSVDGISVTVTCWFSALQPLNLAQKRATVAALMLAQAFPPAPVDTGISGSFVL